MLVGGVFYLGLVAVLAGRRLALDADMASRHVSRGLKVLFVLLHAFKTAVLAVPGLGLLWLVRPWAAGVGLAAVVLGHLAAASAWRRHYDRLPDRIPRRTALVWTLRVLLAAYAVQLAAAAPLLVLYEGDPAGGRPGGEAAVAPETYVVPLAGLWPVLDAYFWPEVAPAKAGKAAPPASPSGGLPAVPPAVPEGE